MEYIMFFSLKINSCFEIFSKYFSVGVFSRCLRPLLFLSLLFTLHPSLFTNVFAGDDIHSDAGTFGGQLLKVNVGAKPVSMGESYTAKADDCFGVFWNPAGVSKTEQIDVGFMHNIWISGISQEVITGTLPLGSSSTLTLASIMTNMPRVDGADVFGNPADSYVAYNMVLVASFAKQVSKKGFSLGINAKYIEEAIEKEKASGSCYDIGAIYAPPDKKYSYGLCFQNMFSQDMVFVKESFSLPKVYKAGLSYKFLGDRLTCVSDIKKPVDASLSYGIGADYIYNKLLDLRGGWLSSGNFTLGFGIKYTPIFFDYAFVPYDYFGYTHRMSVRVMFDMPVHEKNTDTENPQNRIYGKVTDKTDRPVGQATLKVIVDNKEAFKAKADSQGKYTTPEIPYGNYMVKASRTLYLPLTKTFELNKWKENPELNFQLEAVKPFQHIYGHICDPAQKPLINVVVKFSRDGKELFRTETDENGNYETPELPNGTYILVPVSNEIELSRKKKVRLYNRRITRVDFMLEVVTQGPQSQ